jgi:hypothetical protein
MVVVHGDEQTSNMVDPAVGGSLTRTFVVRVWEPPEPVWGHGGGLRGVVEHVQTGASAAFESTDALLAFLQTARDPETGSMGGAS